MPHVKGFANDKNGEITGYSEYNTSGYMLDIVISPLAKKVIKKASEDTMTLEQDVIVALAQKALSETDIDEDELESNLSLMHFKNITLGALVVFEYPDIKCYIISSVETGMIENCVSKNSKNLDLGWCIINFANKTFTHLGRFNYNIREN